MRPVTKISIFGTRLAVVLLAIYWLALFTGTHLPSMMDISSSLDVTDKTKHFTAYFVLGAMLCYVTNSPNWFRRFFGIGLIGMGYAAVDELTQQFIPGRYADSMDFLADSAGIWCAIGIYVAAKLAHKRARKSSMARGNLGSQ